MDLAVVAATHDWDFAWSSQFVSCREACEVQGFAVATPASQSAGCPARFHAALCSSFHYRSPPPSGNMPFAGRGPEAETSRFANRRGFTS